MPNQVVNPSGTILSLGAIAANWLSFAAAPSYALMAVLTGAIGGGPLEVFCSAMHGASPLTGMTTMYVLMSAFHLRPWLRLLPSAQSRDQSL